ncbi:MAG: hypothetical protein KIT72_08165 [Polyangiaceae bacterium]|nr:hypothetical protein [Polyangiaceae bacterium]MCW5790381.1 hypothetical protein [Polyangiaceae bacterium]
MPLCEYFLASEAELTSVAEEGAPSDGLIKVDAKGFDVVPVESLANRLGLDDAVEAGEPTVHGEGFEWFAQRLTPEMVTALASLDEGALQEHARALIETPEVEWPEGDLIQLLKTLSEMAQRAQREGKALCMWVSV